MNFMRYLHMYRIETQQFGGLTVNMTLRITMKKHNKLDMATGINSAIIVTKSINAVNKYGYGIPMIYGAHVSCFIVFLCLF